METLFLNFIQAIDDNRFWLGPILAMLALVMAAREVIGTVQDEIERSKDNY